MATNGVQVKFDVFCSNVGAGGYAPSASSASIPGGSDEQGTAGKSGTARTHTTAAPSY
jgi:hypothetical protein